MPALIDRPDRLATHAIAPRPTTEGVRAAAPIVPRFDCLSPTVFHQPWWLEIATGGQYGVVETRHNGKVVGRMPYALIKRLGMTVSRMPVLTHFLGPGIDEGAGTANTRFLQRLEVTRELIGKLPRVANFRQTFHRGVENLLPFQMAGFGSAVLFTHEIRPQPKAAIWHALRDKTRNMVRKGQRTYECEICEDADYFIRLYTDNLRAAHRTARMDMSVCRALVEASLRRRCGRIYLARSKAGAVGAAIFCAWDAVSAYFLMATRAPGSGNSANSLLLWQAITDMTGSGLIFDFDGVGQDGHVLFYIGFSPLIQPRYVAFRSGRLIEVASSIRHMIANARSPFY